MDYKVAASACGRDYRKNDRNSGAAPQSKRFPGQYYAYSEKCRIDSDIALESGSSPL